jgi:hypothetical protein
MHLRHQPSINEGFIMKTITKKAAKSKTPELTPSQLAYYESCSRLRTLFLERTKKTKTAVQYGSKSSKTALVAETLYIGRPVSFFTGDEAPYNGMCYIPSSEHLFEIRMLAQSKDDAEAIDVTDDFALIKAIPQPLIIAAPARLAGAEVSVNKAEAHVREMAKAMLPHLRETMLAVVKNRIDGRIVKLQNVKIPVRTVAATRG